MAVKTYSIKQDGNMQLEKNFVVKEFACKDGSDTVLIDSALVDILQKIRNHFGVSININSGYRTISHNKKVGGSPKSKHLEGKAADIVVAGVKPLEVCKYAESIDVKGIGRYNSFVHVDSRSVKAFWDSRNGSEKAVASFGGNKYVVPERVLRYGDKGNDVRWVQDKLNITVDGVYGRKTETAVIRFQRLRGLIQDGIVGKKTLAVFKNLKG